MREFVALLRAVRVVLHMAYGAAIALIYPVFKRASRRAILQCWSAELLSILNIKISTTASRPPLQGCLIVANHISWLDVFVLNSVVPMRFAVRSEVSRWPVIGWLSVRVKTLFIDRKSARAAQRVNLQMTALLQAGECIALFPEETSTDGLSVGNFYASLLQPAVDSRVPVYPVAIRYQDQAGRHSAASAFIGEMTFVESIWNILICRNVHVHLHYTPAIEASDRRSLSVRAHAQILQAVEAMHAAAPVSERPLHIFDDMRSLYGMLITITRRD